MARECPYSLLHRQHLAQSVMTSGFGILNRPGPWQNRKNYWIEITCGHRQVASIVKVAFLLQVKLNHSKVNSGSSWAKSEAGALAIGDTLYKLKLNLGISQKILNGIEAIMWKFSV
jgi:hypothetical protein